MMVLRSFQRQTNFYQFVAFDHTRWVEITLSANKIHSFQFFLPSKWFELKWKKKIISLSYFDKFLTFFVFHSIFAASGKFKSHSTVFILVIYWFGRFVDAVLVPNQSLSDGKLQIFSWFSLHIYDSKTSLLWKTVEHEVHPTPSNTDRYSFFCWFFVAWNLIMLLNDWANRSYIKLWSEFALHSLFSSLLHFHWRSNFPNRKWNSTRLSNVIMATLTDIAKWYFFHLASPSTCFYLRSIHFFFFSNDVKCRNELGNSLVVLHNRFRWFLTSRHDQKAKEKLQSDWRMEGKLSMNTKIVSDILTRSIESVMRLDGRRFCCSKQRIFEVNQFGVYSSIFFVLAKLLKRQNA